MWLKIEFFQFGWNLPKIVTNHYPEQESERLSEIKPPLVMRFTQPKLYLPMPQRTPGWAKMALLFSMVAQKVRNHAISILACF